MMEIIRYQTSMQDVWNAFVQCSKQGTFLHDRRYMDYHSDRFHDHSLLIYRDGKLAALLPANECVDALTNEKTLFSHQGLTYGGLITDSHTTAADVCDMFRHINNYLKAEGFTHVVYKPIPHIYHRIPAEEDLYALFNVCHAQLKERSISSTIDVQHPLKWSHGRTLCAKKALQQHIQVMQSDDFASFWRILEDNLMHRYHAKPVHSLEEILLLHSHFPDNIQLHVGALDDHILGGTLLYITPQVAHTQYISASEEGKQSHVLDAIFHELLTVRCHGHKYFDFGTSTEDHGRYLNESLIFQKEGFGGRGIVYDTYEWQL